MHALKGALIQPNESNLASANAMLDHFQETLNTDVCYLMDPQGNTIASSNRNAQDSFVGKNFIFRPYFQKAIKGHPPSFYIFDLKNSSFSLIFSGLLVYWVGTVPSLKHSKITFFDSGMGNKPVSASILAKTTPSGA